MIDANTLTLSGERKIGGSLLAVTILMMNK